MKTILIGPDAKPSCTVSDQNQALAPEICLVVPSKLSGISHCSLHDAGAHSPFLKWGGGEIKWSSAKFEELLCSLFWWTLVCWQYSELCVDLNWTPYVILNPGMLRFLLFCVTSCRTQNRIFWSTQEYSHNTTLSFFTFFSETETVFKKWSKSVLS